MFELTEGQKQALVMVKKLAAQEPTRPYIGIMRGYAGTGKTTMLRVISQEIGEIHVITPTGKAAARVKEATGLGASTIHSYLYSPIEDPLTGQITYKRKAVEAPPASGVIVVEEASMVGLQIWEDIYKAATELKCHILCVGDPFQLPPVEERTVGDEVFGLLLPNFKFDFEVTLTEITRQALESPIIRASMKLRLGNPAEAVMELPRTSDTEMCAEHLKVFDAGGVVIVHRNSTRHEMNSRIRAAKGYSDKTLSDGEPLLVLLNNKELQFYNGEVFQFESWLRKPGRQWEIYDRYRQSSDTAAYGVGIVNGRECAIVPKAILGKLDKVGVAAISMVAETAVGKRFPYLHCNFGYTLTAHKSQGSEFDKVMVVVEKSCQPFTLNGRRFLYTAVTRSKKDVSLVWQPDLQALGFPVP